MNRSAASRRRPRRGSSLLEVVLAGSLLAVALVPALRMMRDGLRISREMETRDLVVTFCTSTLEEHLAGVSADWQTGTYTGDFSADGHSQLRFSVERSDDAGDGGIPDQLMAVTATVWSDDDSDSTLDAGEASLVLASKVAKLSSYEDEVAGG